MPAFSEADILRAVDIFMVGHRKKAEEIIAREYRVGQDVIRSELGMSRAFIGDPETMFAKSVLRSNANLLTGVGRRYAGEVKNLTSDALTKGWNPEKLEKMFKRTNVQVESSLRTVAWDQTAKAQQVGRNTEYAKLGVQRVVIRVAPDACSKCQPHNKMIEPAQGGDRPQYHIRCACYDVPARQEHKRLAGLRELDKSGTRNKMLNNYDATKLSDKTWNKSYKPWYDNLSKAEKQALIDYQEENIGTFDVCERLRASGGDLSALTSKERTVIKGMDAAIDKSKLPWDARIYRGIGAEGQSMDDVFRGVKSKIGTEIEWPSFSSGSMSAEQSTGYATIGGNGYLCELRLPQGYKGAWMNAFPDKGWHQQYEFIMARNAKFKVVDVVKLDVTEWSWSEVKEIPLMILEPIL